MSRRVGMSPGSLPTSPQSKRPQSAGVFRPVSSSGQDFRMVEYKHSKSCHCVQSKDIETCKHENQALKKKISGLEQDLLTARTKHARLVEQYKNLELEAQNYLVMVKKYKEKGFSITANLIDGREDDLRHRRKIQALDDRCRELEQQLIKIKDSESGCRLEELQIQNKVYLDEIRSMRLIISKDYISTTVQEIEHLRSVIGQKDEKIASLEMDKKNLQKGYEEAQKDIGIAKSDMQILDSEHNQEKKLMHEQHTEEISRWTSTTEALRGDILNLQKDIDRLKLSESGLQNEIHRIKTQQENDAKQHKAMMASKEEEHARMQQESRKVESQLRTELSISESNINSLKTQVSQLDEHVKKLEERLRVTQEEKDECCNKARLLEGQTKDLGYQLEATKEELDSSHKQYEQAQVELSKTEEAMSGLRFEITSKIADAQSKDERIRQLGQRETALLEELDAAKIAKEASFDKIRRLESDVADARMKLMEAEGQTSVLKSKLDLLNQRFTIEQESHIRLADELKKSRGEVERMGQDRLQEIQRVNDAYQKQIQSSKTIEQRMQDELLEARHTMKIAEFEKASLEKYLSTQSEIRQQLEAGIDRLNSELRKTVEDHTQEVKKYEDRLRQYEEQIAQLSREIAKEKANRSLYEDIKDERDKVIQELTKLKKVTLPDLDKQIDNLQQELNRTLRDKEDIDHRFQLQEKNLEIAQKSLLESQHNFERELKTHSALEAAKAQILLQDLNAKLKDSETNLEKERKEKGELVAQIQELKNQLAAVERELKSLQVHPHPWILFSKYFGFPDFWILLTIFMSLLCYSPS
eukprot:TRINITY_DN1813_c0_g1_i1.p1 TRINITY_DN1813_c0_g1~~TRINITY_DN1813_c0_g1_i1.p1  ORF type:complete len:814 (+),score=193.13 TRINITY_DN1813_c0_g1_i1:152-2593(+)